MQKTDERIPISKEQKRAGDHMRLIGDRTEGNRVICEQEDGTNIELSVTCFKTRPQDGTVVVWDGILALPDPPATAARKQKLQSRFDRLKKE